LVIKATDKHQNDESSVSRHPEGRGWHGLLFAVFEGGSMKCSRFTLFGLGLLLAVSAGHAQEAGVKANIPFDFVVGNQVLPAGEYLVTPASSSRQVILIRSSDNKAAMFATAFGCSSSRPPDQTKLVFHTMGGRYFLYQVWPQGYAQGSELPKSKIEVQLAKNGDTSGEFVLAAKATH
jgi:hypothetical protein